jgi:UDP-N-acetylmuramyl pentapeptide phosphotransferase/UDP-N-acetylglucosamine-1-phosphate transferase
MASIWIATCLAAALTVALLLLLLRRAGDLPVDRPNERSLHQRPTPRIGGLALFPGVVLASVAAGEGNPDTFVLLGLATLLFLVSIADDRSSLPAGQRFAAHFLVAGAFATWVLGFSLLTLIGALAVTWMTNLYNFMDGANGLAGGMAAIGFGMLGLGSGDPVLAFAVVGAALGFLLFNFDPAKVFLGDAGSIPLGFLAGGLGLLGVALGRWPVWFPVLVFAPFVIDATVTLLRRMVRREAFWKAHRQHYYQRLVRMGWSHRRLALAEYALMAASGLTALWLLGAGPLAQLAGLTAWLSLYAMLMWWIDRRWVLEGVAE